MAILLAGFATGAIAQSEQLSHNRILFVVDTSSGMKKQAAKERDAVENLLRGSFNGQLHPGDTIGVWTFNDTVYTGQLPLQMWLDDNQAQVVANIDKFLREQTYEKHSHLNSAMASINRVVSRSDVITVVIVSDGQTPLAGTPVDDEVSKLYAQNITTMKKNPEPIVTVLVGKAGSFTHEYAVSAMPWPVVVPDLPASTMIAKKPATPAPAAQPPVGQPIIVVGSKESAESSTAPSVKPVPTQANIVPVVISKPPAAPAPAPAIAPVAPPPTAPVAVTPPPTIASAETQVSTTPAAAPTPIPVPAPSPAPAVATTSQPMVQSASVEPPRPHAVPFAATQPPVAPASEPAVASTPAPAEVAPVVPQTSSAPSPSPVVASAPAVAATRTVETTSAQPAPANTPIAKPAAPAPSRPSVIAQATAPSRSLMGSYGQSVLIGVVSLLILGLGMMAIHSRRANAAGRVSLISQTMNNQPR